MPYGPLGPREAPHTPQRRHPNSALLPVGSRPVSPAAADHQGDAGRWCRGQGSKNSLPLRGVHCSESWIFIHVRKPLLEASAPIISAGATAQEAEWGWTSSPAGLASGQRGSRLQSLPRRGWGRQARELCPRGREGSGWTAGSVCVRGCGCGWGRGPFHSTPSSPLSHALLLPRPH